MNKISDSNSVASYYDRRWQYFKLWWQAEETYGIHYGYYDKNIKNFKQAVLNMNNYVGNLLGLEKNKKCKILDAGCGVGGTSIYLAQKYPKTNFIGITNSINQIEFGRNYINDNNIKNVNLHNIDFLNTNFKDNTFDGIIAIESAGYSKNISEFIDEMKRILKPNGKLIVCDGFRIKNEIDDISEMFYKKYLYGQGYSDLDLPNLNMYLKMLEDKGFEKIISIDISKNVAKSQLRGVILGFPYMISYILKKIFSCGIVNSRNNFLEFSMGVSVFAPIIALKNISRYFMTYAIKKG
jgi:cyclopropane fatty-acyl-phospholipid synthase-like methyltransferase